MKKHPIVNIGEEVIIVSSANKCIYGCNSYMKKLIGCTAVVTNISWDTSNLTYEYRLDIDQGRYMWCDKCIEAAGTDIEESDIGIETLLGGA